MPFDRVVVVVVVVVRFNRRMTTEMQRSVHLCRWSIDDGGTDARGPRRAQKNTWKVEYRDNSSYTNLSALSNRAVRLTQRAAPLKRLSGSSKL